MEEKVRDALLKNFTIKRMMGLCNSPRCKSKPSFHALVKIIYLKEQKSKDIASIYLCEKHLESLNSLIKHLNDSHKNERSILRAEIKNI